MYDIFKINLRSNESFLNSDSNLVKHNLSFNDGPYNLIILNQPIHYKVDFFKRLWCKATIIICCDGGFNELLSYCQSHGLSPIDFLPSKIIGDLDSIFPKNRQFAKEHGVEIVEMKDQGRNDFEKALILLHDYQNGTTKLNNLAIGCLSGRFDQVLANLYVLYNYSNVLLLGESSLVLHIKKGVHQLSWDSSFIGQVCGYTSLDEPAIVTTQGFKWDVDKKMIGFKNSISTSNIVEKEEGYICTTGNLILTVEMRSDQ